MCLCSSAAERDESTKNAYLTVLLLLLLLSCFSRVRLCGTPEKAAHQAPLSLGFSRQEYWSGLPLPSPIPCCYEYSKTSLRVYVRRAKHGAEGSSSSCVFTSVSACTSSPLSLPPRFHLPRPYSALSPLCPCPQTLPPKTQLNTSSRFTPENTHTITLGLNNHEY